MPQDICEPKRKMGRGQDTHGVCGISTQGGIELRQLEIPFLSFKLEQSLGTFQLERPQEFLLTYHSMD